MKKILIAALATSFALSVGNTYASEEDLNTNKPAIEEAVENSQAPASQIDKNIVIYEIETKDPNKGPDYVVLYNKGSEYVNLNGWYLVDDGGFDKRFVFTDTSIAPGQKLKLTEKTQGSFQFGLGKNDGLHLYNANDEVIHEHSWPAHPNGVLRLNPDTMVFSELSYEELAKESSKPAPTPDPEPTPSEAELVSTGIIINEVQSKGANKAKDYVELKNTTDHDISLKGWYILDDDDNHEVTSLGDITIPAGGYVVLTEDSEFKFGLGKNDQVRLFTADGRLTDKFAWESHTKGKVWAREDDGTWQINDPTPGANNSSTPTTQPAEETDTNTPSERSAITEVVINEVESSDASGGNDYVEIYNKSDKDIDISGWYILDNGTKHKKDPKYQVKEGTIIKAQGFFVFEENLDFNFGLGSNDEVNLIDKDDKLVDKFEWTSHAKGTYGRVPDGTGEFVDGSPSKGKANNPEEEVSVDVDTNTWPGLEDIEILDQTSVFDLQDLSGLDNHEGWLYGVNNKEGRFFVFRVVDGKVEFAPGFDAKGKAVNFKTDADDPTKLGPDSEGITVDDEGRVYLAVERDNNNKNVNYNVILQVADPFKDEKVMVADKQWNITSLLPDVGANLGIETIEWVSFNNLNGLLYDQSKNKPLDRNDYKDAYANGVFFVGLEANGHIYALILSEDETAKVIADIPTGLGGVMGMDYDTTNNVLWAQADDGYNNILALIQFNGTDNPTKIHLDAPKQMDKKLNNEGFVIDPTVDENGNRNAYWFKDGTNDNAFRRGKLSADYMKELGLSVIPGKEISKEKPEEPSSNNSTLEASKKSYKEAIGSLYNLAKAEKDAYIKRLDKASTKEQLKTIYDEAVALHTSRAKAPSSGKQTPKPNTPWNPTTPSTSNKVVVGKGYKYIKAGTYDRKDLEAKREKLKEALKKNEIQAQAAKFLLEYTPKTVSKIKGQLEDLIKEAEKLQEQARVAIREMDKILK